MIMRLENSPVDLYGMYHALAAMLTARYPDGQRQARQCHESLSMAIGYVWGREELEASVTSAYGRDVIAYHEFGYMYGIVCLMYKLDMIFMKPSITHAWDNFRAGRDLNGWSS